MRVIIIGIDENICTKASGTDKIELPKDQNLWLFDCQ